MGKKMSNKKFIAIMAPVLVLGMALGIGATVAGNYWSQTLDTYVGRGDRVVSNPKGTEDWDTNYYNKECASADGANGSKMKAAALTKRIADEGIVLLKNKNNTLPLAKNSNVVPFGYRYADPVYGGTGSGAVDSSEDYIETAVEGLKRHFNVNAGVSNKLINNTGKAYALSTTELKQINGEVNNEGEGGGAFNGANTDIIEFKSDIYEGLVDSVTNDTAVVYIGRIAGEGGNLLNETYFDGTRDSLALSQYEKDTIRLAKEKCKKVVVIINSSNIMEIKELMSGELEADAILWTAGPGSKGFESLADIMVGDVNPSGRTPDIWDANVLNNPTIINFGDHKYKDTDGISLWNGQNGVYYYEYEEGIYYGYRYYETAHDIHAEGFNYDEAVTFPFGYGLSYTSFEQSITSVDERGDSIKVTVEVKNTGSVDGKEAVQIYYTAPYTALDQELHIEKATKNLIAFDKVEVKAGGKKSVTLEFPKEEMASYSYLHDNKDGTKGCYFLEEGDYTITLGKNSHEAWDSHVTHIGDNTYYTNANPRKSEIAAQSQWDDEGNALPFPAAAASDRDAKFMAATNRFEDISAYMESSEATILSRKDWKNTQPSAPAGEKSLSAVRLDRMRSFDYKTDERLGETETSLVYQKEAPVSGKKNGLTMVDMRGKDYFDPLWEDYLDQIDFSNDEVMNMFLKAFSTSAVESIAKPATIDHDGPQGLGSTGQGGGLGACAYCSEPLVAATFNVGLAHEYGLAIGEEALNINCNGWYGPGANIHRSPLNGRNFEYYSEDPVLTGKIAAACVSGAEEKGLVVYLKHFGWHDYEGVCTSMTAWMTEQAYRETDMKAFEITIKEARKTIKYISDDQGTVKTKTVRGISGLMGAATHVGTEWQAANYDLNVGLTRGEWGFQGLFSTDMGLEAQPGSLDKVLRSGTDLRMHFMPLKTAMDFRTVTMADDSSATVKHCLRRAVKNVCFAYANSNVVQGAAPGAIISYTMSPWAIGLTIGDCVLGALIVAGVVWTVIRVRKNKGAPVAE
ncbi:MAG: glycoside hydrolase family 3 C-terminal domain-containing protein [Candidatus Enteromonas sp.]|nr:glycoside hydrolase family 3 C-terminal domain-containing protein [Candidatus Enteromonas sp.]MEE3464694.1 glycoside hydrolase family 3 C-terminal domain-containing protein [Candidatus Enteromonas sp.]